MAEFRLELMRRIELLDREIRALDPQDPRQASAGAVELLGRLRKELQERLSGMERSESWSESRAEIIVVWRRYRHEFEQLAAAWKRRHAVSPGQWERGPRW